MSDWKLGEPVAAASIAQVHKATVLDADGTQRNVAVKVMRPGVRERFARDIQAMRFMARIVQALLPDAERLRPRGGVGDVDSQIRLVLLREAVLASAAVNLVEELAGREGLLGPLPGDSRRISHTPHTHHRQNTYAHIGTNCISAFSFVS